MPSTLALLNDILQAVIVIFGVSVILYNMRYFRRDRIVRAFSILLTAVVLVYFAELVVSRTRVEESAETFLRIKWLGISLLPAAQYHLADALLTTTGSFSSRRRVVTGFLYLVGILCFIGVLMGVVTSASVSVNEATYLSAGRLFPAFSIYFWSAALLSGWLTYRAWQRCITKSTRTRMRGIFAAIMAAPLSVFPYLAASGNSQPVSTPMWLLLIFGNLMVGFMFSQLTNNIVHLGSVSSDRVVRVRLYKFMARVPMAASIALLAYWLTTQTDGLFGLESATSGAISVIGTFMLVEWAIHAYKAPIERALQLNNEPDVRRIQILGDRLLTPQDLNQFLESLLAAACEALRAPSGFVASIDQNKPVKPKLEALIGSNTEFINLWQDDHVAQLPHLVEGNSDRSTLRWLNYWVIPLYTRQGDSLVGILGIEATNNALISSAEEEAIYARAVTQAANALEDQRLQQGIFAAVEGLLPSISAFQEARGQATFSGQSLLDKPQADPVADAMLEDPDFRQSVRDALTHYWGGPKLTESPLLNLQIVQSSITQHGSPTKALRAVLENAIESQKPDGEPSLGRPEWVLYNILELKFLQGIRVRDIARRLAMSESDLYRKQRVAIENVARAISKMEAERLQEQSGD